MKENFNLFAHWVSDRMGKPYAFLLAFASILLWLVLGPAFQFSNSWQLLINTATTIITFLMVFLIQTTQNKDARAIHLKLDELIRAQKTARNAFADLEHATEDEMKLFEEEFHRLRERGLRHAEAAHQAAAALRLKKVAHAEKTSSNKDLGGHLSARPIKD